jgi:hypothetical protein
MDSMDNFRERFEALEQRTEHLQQHIRTVERRLRWWRSIACGVMLLGVVSLPLQSGTAADTQPGGMAERMAAMEKKLRAMTFNDTANEVVITEANLRIVNGLGSTETTNGLGNLIVGYNELRQEISGCSGSTTPFCTDRRTGSHNVVVGKQDNFSSFGGIVVGLVNEISGQYASVSGGAVNTASGISSSISGGVFNTASGLDSSVSGGGGNTASGISSSISGGGDNSASGLSSSVSGGELNLASSTVSSVSGGAGNTASGENASVSGGAGNTASGRFSSVSGGGSSFILNPGGQPGTGNTASGDSSSVSGGENNTASGNFSSVSGGNNRTAPATDNWAAGALFSDH